MARRAEAPELDAPSAEAQALEAVYACHAPGLRRRCLQLTSSPDAADELMQEVFVRFIERFPRPPADMQVGGYLNTMARNVRWNQLRDSHEQPDGDLEASTLADDDLEVDPERALLLGEQRGVVRRCAALLTGRQRRALTLRDVEGHSYAEIGSELGIGEDAVAQVISRARIRLRGALRRAAVDIDTLPADCRDMLKPLSEYLDGRAALHAPEIESHLAGCAACRQTLALYEEAGSRLRGFAPFIPIAALASRVRRVGRPRALVSRARHSVRSTPRRAGTFAAVGLLALTGGGLLVRQLDEPSSSMPAATGHVLRAKGQAPAAGRTTLPAARSAPAGARTAPTVPAPAATATRTTGVAPAAQRRVHQLQVPRPASLAVAPVVHAAAPSAKSPVHATAAPAAVVPILVPGGRTPPAAAPPTTVHTTPRTPVRPTSPAPTKPATTPAAVAPAPTPTKPVVTKPVVTQPVVTKPVVTKPVVTTPAVVPPPVAPVPPVVVPPVVVPPVTPVGPPTIALGASASFAVLAGAGITNTGLTTVTGDLGAFPTLAITGLVTLALTGSNQAGGAVTQQAKVDLASAFAAVGARAATATVASGLGGRTLTPGVYDSGSSLDLTGALTLDGGGDPNAVFILRAGSTLTTASASQVVLAGGARACNVFWLVGSSATLGTGSSFRGTILAATSVTVTTGVAIDGRVLARDGAVTLDSDSITRSTAC